MTTCSTLICNKRFSKILEKNYTRLESYNDPPLSTSQSTSLKSGLNSLIGVICTDGRTPSPEIMNHFSSLCFGLCLGTWINADNSDQAFLSSNSVEKEVLSRISFLTTQLIPKDAKKTQKQLSSHIQIRTISFFLVAKSSRNLEMFRVVHV